VLHYHYSSPFLNNREMHTKVAVVKDFLEDLRIEKDVNEFAAK
jgi:hypothetical protein